MKANELPGTPNAPDQVLRTPDELHASAEELLRTPDDRFIEETDGDPQTLYEDLKPHERLGFRVDDSKPLDLSANPDKRIEQNSGKPY